MPIISVRDNENSRWKRNTNIQQQQQQKTPPKQTKTEKSKGEQKL